MKRNTKKEAAKWHTIVIVRDSKAPVLDVGQEFFLKAGTGYTAQKITPELRQRSRPVSPDKGRRGPLQNTRLFCSAVSGLRCQVVAPIAFCSHDYEKAFPESNPVRLLAEMSRPATERDDGARQGKLEREVTCVPSRFSD